MEGSFISARFGGGYSTKIVRFDFDVKKLNVNYVEKKLDFPVSYANIDNSWKNMVVKTKLQPVEKNPVSNLGDVEMLRKGGRQKKQAVVRIVRKLIN